MKADEIKSTSMAAREKRIAIPSSILGELGNGETCY
jgi:hypothetical protein